MIRDGSETTGQRVLRWFFRPVMTWVWYVGGPVVLILQATPDACVQSLAKATKPSVRQLHFRNLYASGRRYFLRPHKDGFQMTTTRSVSWNYRRRTASTTVVTAQLELMDEGLTRVCLQPRMNVVYLATSLSVWMPIFVISWLIYAPWHPAVISVLVVILVSLSWAGHRLTAFLDAGAMIWFVQKVLEDFIPEDVPTLSARRAPVDVVYEQYDFEREWERFYSEHRDES